MQKMGMTIVLAVLMQGCAVSGPLPAYTLTGSVVEYTDALVNATTANNLDRFIDTTKDGQTDGYRWYKGWWCPAHETVEEVADVKREYAEFCRASGGIYDYQQFCHVLGDSDNILFVAKVWATGECSSGTTVSLDIVEPTSSQNHANYQVELHRFGYETHSERSKRQIRQAEARKVAQEISARRMEQDRLKAQARKEAVLSSAEGTRLCKSEPIESFLGQVSASVRDSVGILSAQLDGFNEDRSRVRIRVLAFNILDPNTYESNYLIADNLRTFAIEPGSVYWDRPENWSVCD